MPSAEAKAAVTLPDFARWKSEKRAISVLTAYDFPMARLFDEAGVDCILVGDTLGMVVQGHDTTLPVTLDQMVYHAEMVGRAARRAMVVADLPFMTYQASIEQALQSAGRLMKETRARAVKLEGGHNMAATIYALVNAGIPVMGHVGLRPQAVHQYGGYKVQRARELLIADAKAVSEAGAFALVVECVSTEIAREITALLPIPTIGIGAGVDCDGQVLVAHDVLGLYQRFHPKFARRYANLGEVIRNAARAFVTDVQARRFPNANESFQ
jgi:3-methyl-2-oxobutanoate hydroxymethyltransferase